MLYACIICVTRVKQQRMRVLYALNVLNSNVPRTHRGPELAMRDTAPVPVLNSNVKQQRMRVFYVLLCNQCVTLPQYLC
jgi:hypothetical protein